MEDTLEDYFDTSPGMLFVADKEGELRLVSRELRAYVGTRIDDHQSLQALVDERDRGAVEALLGSLVDSEEENACRVGLTDSAGDSRPLRCLARRSARGTVHGHFEPEPAPPMWEVERVLFRTVMNTLDIALWAVDTEGVFVFQDGKGLAKGGLEPNQFVGSNILDIYPPELIVSVRSAWKGEPRSFTSEAHGVHWESWVVPLLDAAGEVSHAAGLSMNISERVESQRALERQLETIKSQQGAIFELSAPLINVWDQVLTVPLIGGLDTQRSEELSERLLGELHRSDIRFTILDLTGVDTVDTSIASHILRLMESMRLLGVEGMITGLSPEVARTMVGVGIDFAAVSTHRSLREAVHYCMRELLRTEDGDALVLG